MLISFAFISFFSLFRMEKVVTSVTKRDQIAVFKCQLRVFVIVLDMMHRRCLTLTTVSLAPLALVSVAPQDKFTFLFPALAIVKF